VCVILPGLLSSVPPKLFSLSPCPHVSAGASASIGVATWGQPRHHPPKNWKSHTQITPTGDLSPLAPETGVDRGCPSLSSLRHLFCASGVPAAPPWARRSSKYCQSPLAVVLVPVIHHNRTGWASSPSSSHSLTQVLLSRTLISGTRFRSLAPVLTPPPSYRPSLITLLSPPPILPPSPRPSGHGKSHNPS
jgi:hypothetical protein